MLITKDKMYLRSLANRLNPVFQIGKDGINENMVRDILAYLNKHELMKVKLLETCPLDKKEAMDEFKKYDIEEVFVIGRTLVIYKRSEEDIEHLL